MLARLPEERRPAFSLTIAGLKSNSFVELAAAMPKSVAKCLNEPSLRELELVEPQRLTMFLEAAIIRMASRMNVANKMTSAQVVYTAQVILNEYPIESLAEIVLATERLAAGFYGTTYHQLDTAVIVGAIKQILEEKAVYLEREHQKEVKAEASNLVDYRAYIERQKKEQAQREEQKAQAIERRRAEIHEQITRRALTDEETRIRLVIAEILKERYAKLTTTELDGFRIHHADGVPIFARSQEEAGEILGEALVRIELARKNAKQKPQP